MNRKTILALALTSAFALSTTGSYAQSDEKQEAPKPELIADSHEKPEAPKPELIA